MKKLFLLTTTVILLCITTSYAQSKQGDVNFGIKYGFMSGQSFASGFENDLYGDDTETTGAITGSVEYLFTDAVSVGLSYTYEKITTEVGLDQSDTYSIPMLSTTVRYINKPNYKLYGYGGLGGYFTEGETNDMDDNRKSSGIAFQVSPIGIQFGNQFAVKIEAGFGYQGLLLGGINGSF